MFIFLNPYLRRLNSSGGNAMIRVNNTSFVDTVYGDDSTGTFELLDKPFKTIQAAVNSLPISGMNIFVWSGKYIENVVAPLNLKFNIIYDIGAEHHAANSNLLIDASGSGLVSIYGKGYFYSNLGPCLGHSGGGNSRVSIFGAQTIYSTASYAVGVCNLINNVDLIQSNASHAITMNGAPILKNLNLVTSSSNVTINTINGIPAKIENCNIVNTGTYSCIYGNDTTSDRIFKNSTFKSNSAVCVETRDNIQFYNCNFFANNSIVKFRNNFASGQAMFKNCYAYSNSANPLITSTATLPHKIVISNLITNNTNALNLGTGAGQLDAIIDNFFQDSLITNQFI